MKNLILRTNKVGRNLLFDTRTVKPHETGVSVVSSVYKQSSRHLPHSSRVIHSHFTVNFDFALLQPVINILYSSDGIVCHHNERTHEHARSQIFDHTHTLSLFLCDFASGAILRFVIAYSFVSIHFASHC